jgi:hypothetical protein
LYYNFEYVEAKPFFHTFESEDEIVGFSFASVPEAKMFFMAVMRSTVSLIRSSSQLQNPLPLSVQPAAQIGVPRPPPPRPTRHLMEKQKFNSLRNPTTLSSPTMYYFRIY